MPQQWKTGEDIVNLSKPQGTRPTFTLGNKQVITRKFMVSLKSIIFLLNPMDCFFNVNWSVYNCHSQILSYIPSIGNF